MKNEQQTSEGAPGGVATDCYADPPQDSAMPLDGPRYAERWLRKIWHYLRLEGTKIETERMFTSRFSFRFYELRGEARAVARITKQLDRELIAAAAVANGIAPEASVQLDNLIALQMEESEKPSERSA